MSILIKNARIIDPSQKIDSKGSIYIEKGEIISCGGASKKKADTVIDAGGKIAAPCFIDMHAHLREPGREDQETIRSGLRAAVAGGFTTVCAMPNTDPPCDNQAHVKFLLEKAREAKMADLLPVGTITRRREGKEISEMGELKASGAPALSDDGSSVEDAELMRRAMEYASMLDLLIISHCEDKALAGKGVMREGYWSTVLGLEPIPAEAESTVVERDARLAELAGARLHIAHVSTEQSVDIIRAAKKRGVKITAEATPHHFSLHDRDLRTFDTNMKVNPPLGTEKDVKAVRQGLRDGTIDVIATDHAPHLESEKEKEFDYAPFGMIGFETALSLAVMNLVDSGILDWGQLIGKLTANPAAILKAGKGTLKEGSPADVVIIDPGKEWTYDKKQIRSASSNSPFVGKKMKASVTHVIRGGRPVYRNGQLV